MSQSWDAGGLPVSCPHCRQRFHTGWSHLATIFLWLEWCFLWNVGVFWKVLPGQPQGFPDCPCPWARPCGSTFLASPPAVLQFLFCPPPPLLVQLPALALDRAGLRHLRHPQGHSGSRLPVSSKGLEGRAGQAGPMGATGLWEQRGLVGSQQGRQPPPTLDSRGPSGHKGQGRASEEGNRGSGPPQQLPSPAPSLQGQPRVSILLEATVAGLAVSSLPFVGMRGMWAGPGGLGHFLPPPLLLSSLWAPPALPSLGVQLSGPSRPRVRLLGRLQPELVLREEGGRLGAGAGGESRTSRAARELVPAAVSWASGSNRSSLGRDSLPGSRGRLLYKAFFFFFTTHFTASRGGGLRGSLNSKQMPVAVGASAGVPTWSGVPARPLPDTRPPREGLLETGGQEQGRSLSSLCPVPGLELPQVALGCPTPADHLWASAGALASPRGGGCTC